MKKILMLLMTLLISLTKVQAQAPLQYYCTAASQDFYPRLINLIGSIHVNNFENVGEIAVFDLGLKPTQIQHLRTIQRVRVYPLKERNPNLLTFFQLPSGQRVLGWYMWKPVVIKEALERFPYVLWLDAGTTVLKPLDDLFAYIEENQYFLSTIGDEQVNGKILHPISWQSTAFLVNTFRLNSPENQWILPQEPIMGGIIGVSKNGYEIFAKEWYMLTKDIRYFEDNGTTPNGYGTGRHDQAVLSILGYLKGLNVHKQDHQQHTPMHLSVAGEDIPFYITWNRGFVDDRTSLYSSRGDIDHAAYYQKQIRYKKPIK